MSSFKITVINLSFPVLYRILNKYFAEMLAKMPQGHTLDPNTIHFQLLESIHLKTSVNVHLVLLQTDTFK
ncbi:hypothetical protein T06_9163 [Trichinella sp. T6]|nr:hypothetical protein T06_9163 [Trichinella sp. T6]